MNFKPLFATFFFSTCTLGISAAETTAPMIIAHRGASAYAPENTLAAARLGWQMGAPAVEIDVYTTADGEVVVMHDRTTKRTTGVDLPVATTSTAQFALLEAGAWKSPQYAGEPVPFLHHVVAAIPDGRTLVIEIKDTPATVAGVKRVLDHYGRHDQAVIISFNKDVCVEARREFPKMPVYWLLGAPKNEETGEFLPIDIVYAAEAAAAGFTGLNVSFRGAHPGLVAACRELGMPLFVWTVNDTADAKRLVSFGVTGITTDKPDVMLEAFGLTPAH